eukprot:CFRG3380T1
MHTMVNSDGNAKKALVTGGAGFVGRHLCHRLVNQGYEVTCVDNLMSESAHPPKTWPEHLSPYRTKKISALFHFVHQDCREYFKTPQSCIEWDYVFHLAAVVGGRESIEKKPLAIAEDLAIDSTMFHWASSLVNKPGRIVFFSSSAAYPIQFQAADDNQRVLEEGMISFDTNIGLADLTYGWAKLTGEYLSRLAHSSYGLNVVCYRPFSGYGEDQDPCYPFPGILQRIMREDGETLSIWSNSVRDFVYIEDCIDCVLQTMDSVNDGTALNIATGVATDFKTLAKMMLKQCGKPDREVSVLTDKPKGVYYRVGDPTLASKNGFTFTTDLERGIQIAHEYLSSLQAEKSNS